MGKVQLNLSRNDGTKSQRAVKITEAKHKFDLDIIIANLHHLKITL